MDELGPDDLSYYQQQIGILRWMVELGRIDICTEISMLAAYTASPRQGHLADVLHRDGTRCSIGTAARAKYGSVFQIISSEVIIFVAI